MSELSTVLGTLMVSLVHARRMADEETAAVAEYYKDHPLLEGMSLPRVRVPELTIDMPITLDEHEMESEAKLNAPATIQKAITDQLKESMSEEGVDDDGEDFAKTFSQETKKVLEQINSRHKSLGGKISREEVVRAVDDSLRRTLKKSNLDRSVPSEKKESIIKAIRHKVSAISLKAPSKPQAFKASAITSAVKEKATSESAVRLRITLREEGLEWATGQSSDGSIRSQLQPE
ncbi:hypothetical protein [Marinimicrobium locisalis]|uniref:hypothetical protein n=1 Tax=Marinimicrobium locisalis TaxID=546022 RepID=UPI0032214364